jgi:hypothetical protein
MSDDFSNTRQHVIGMAVRNLYTSISDLRAEAEKDAEGYSLVREELKDIELIVREGQRLVRILEPEKGWAAA